jgi:hypothetical protein
VSLGSHVLPDTVTLLKQSESISTPLWKRYGST